MAYTLVRTFSFPSSWGTAFKARLYDSAGTLSGSDITGLTANVNGILIVNITIPTDVFIGTYRVWKNATAFTDPHEAAISINGYNSPPAGSGPYLVTIDIDNQLGAALSNATVRVASTTEAYELVTGVTGILTFALTADTYTVTAYKNGYTSYSQQHTISATTTINIDLTAIETTLSPDPDEVIGSLIAYDEDNDPVGSVIFQFQLLKTSCDPTDGQSFPRDIVEITSQAITGLVEIALLEDATYRYRRVFDSANEIYGPWKQFTVDSNPYIIPQVLGKIEGEDE